MLAQQGRRPCGERSVHEVREHGKRSRTQLATFSNLSASFLDHIPNP
jgi:hypothetical protein